MKEYGIHNGARGRIKSWILHPDDVARIQACKEGEVILTQLPSKIIIHMETPMRKNHPDWPEQHFPLSPVTTYWNLAGKFGSEPVEIMRRGFDIVPFLLLLSKARLEEL